MSTREIIKILREMSAECKWFPIPDLVKIIADYIYELPTNYVCTIMGLISSVDSLIELDDGVMVCKTYGGDIRFWKNNECVATLVGHTGPILVLIKLRDGTLASGSGDGIIKLWKEDCLNCKQLKCLSCKQFKCASTLIGHTDDVNTLVELKDDTLVSGSNDGTIKFWKNCDCVESLHENSGVQSLVELRVGSLISGFSCGEIKIWQ